jgi:hypothetical protein
VSYLFLLKQVFYFRRDARNIENVHNDSEKEMRHNLFFIHYLLQESEG